MIQVDMSLGQNYPMSVVNTPPIPFTTFRQNYEPIYQQPSYGTYVPQPQETFASNTMQPGYYYPQQPQTFQHGQQYYESPNYYMPYDNNVRNNQLQPYMNPMKYSTPAPNYPLQNLPPLQQPARPYQNYYPTSVPPPSNYNRKPQMNIPNRYPQANIPYPGYNSIYKGMPMDVPQHQKYPQYPAMMHQPNGYSHGKPPMSPYVDDEIDENDNYNENINANIKDSKFLQLIMKHLQGLILKDDDLKDD